MKDKFQRMVAKAPQNTGGGNSQSFASRSKGAQQTPIMRTDEGRGNNLGITYVSPMYHLGLTALWKYVACMLLALVLGIGQMWGDTYADVYTNPASGSGLAGNANGKGAFSAITCSTGTSFGNSSLQISTSGGSGAFTVASIDGSYITSIAFTSQSSYPINTLTSEQGTITIDENVYTFTPSSATLTSATFSMSAKSGKKVRVAPITVNLTSDHSYLSMNFSVSSGKVSYTKSSGAADLAVTTTGSASSNRLSFGSGKTLTFTSEEHNIAAIHFTCASHANLASVTASSGTVSGSSWAPDSDVKTVTFTSGNSNTIGAISVKLACSTEITTQPSGATLAIGDANPELSIMATNVASYAWKESSDGKSYDGASTLGTAATFTPSVNDAVQTKYYYCEVTSSCDGAAVSKSNIVTVNVVDVISYYTVTLNPAGGTIVDATGWTLKAGNYEKEVAEGTVLTLPTFTKDNRTFKTWRKSGPTDVASPVTVDGNLSLTAIWTATVEQVIYSWEGAEGGAIETGGTVAGSTDGLINQLSAGYYCLKIDGNNSYSGNLVTITLAGEEKVKTGDKIKYWGFYNKSSNTSARPKMRDANSPNAQIFDDGTNLPNLYSGGDPAERTFTVPASINTNAVQLTRSQTGSNTWIPKLQIIREVQVEEGDLLTVTFNYNDGVTPDATIQVASGQAVAKPADPTYAHHRFNEWQLDGVAYDFDDPVTTDITLVANWTQLYTISFEAGGGSGGAPEPVADKAEGETFTVPANTFDAPTTNEEFDIWNDGSDDYAPGVTYTVGTANVVLTAQWKALQDKYTVIFKDGDVTLGTKQFDVASNPSDADIDKTKALSTFAAWQKESVDIALNDEFWATVAKDAEVTLTARWAKAYATSYDMEVYAVSDGATLETLLSNLDAAGYAYTNVNGIDYGHTHNYIYDGMKYKTNDGDLSFNVNAGKLVIVKTGNLPANALTMYINGVADPTVFVGANEAVETHVNNYFYSEAEALYRLDIQASKGTCAIKAVTITDPFTVSFDANGGDDVASLKGTPSVTLPSASKGTDSFLGWFDAAEGGNKIGDAGDTYIPTANITLHAQWETVSTDARLSAITFSSDAGTLSPAFDREVTSYTYTMPYGTADIPTITGATSVNEKAQDPIIGEEAAAWGDAQTVKGVAESGDEKTYTITMLQAPKDGVCLIKGNVGNNTFVIDEEASLLSGTPSKNNVKSSSSTHETLTGWKFNSRPAHLGLTLSEGTFQKGDVVEVFVTSVVDNSGSNDKMRVFTENDVTKMLVEGEADMEKGVNRLVLPETTTNALYLVRGPQDAAYDMWNPFVAYFAVYRAMNPVLTAITINGEACEKGEGNTFAVTLPEATTDLAALTVVPTIVWNEAAETNSIVVNDGSAWVEGDNTYKLTDKDGDATTYTITITLQGEAPAPVIATQPAGVAYCAGSEPTLEVVATGDELHYAWFKEAGDTDEPVGFDQASYTIASAGTYYVIVTNHVNGKLDKSVISENAVVTMNTPASIITQPTDLKKQTEGASITLSVVAANATGYQWYGCDNKDKENPSLIPDADEAEYEFAAAAGFFYCEVTGLCGTIESNVAQVTVKRSAGCQYINATSGSQANLADGTIMYACGSEGKLSTEDIFTEASSNAKAIDADAVGSINKQYCVVKFPVDVEEITLYGYNGSNREINNLCTGDAVGTGLKVNTAFTAYTKSKANDGNERSMTIEFDEPFAKEKYLFIKYNSALEIYRICYTAALVEPVLPKLSNQELCAGAAYEAFDATITNEVACEGTVSYKWYSTNDTENPVVETAEFTPSTDGTYYVVVTHSAAGHITRTVQSDNLTVAHFDALTLVSNSGDVFQHMGTAATLSVVATGKNVAYVWYTCSNAAGDDAEVISSAEEATYAIASVAEGAQYYKVVISHDCDATTLSHVFKVEGWDQLEQVDVTETTTWDMTNVSASAIELSGSDKNAHLLLANINGVNNNANFNSQALYFEGQHIGRTEGSVKHLAGRYVQFNVTVPGAVFVTFASNGNNARTISINGKKCSRTTSGTAADKYITYALAVEPGSVEIVGYEGESANQYVRISRIEFKAEDSYHRTVNPSYLGTLCWTNNAILGGATLYEFAGKNENNYLVFDEVISKRLEAGKPYIFMPEDGNTEIKLYNTDDAAALTEDQDPVNHMYGTIEGKTLVPGENANMYYFSSNHIWRVGDYNVNITVPAYYCYIDYPAVLAGEPAAAPAPGRRRVTMGVQGSQIATGVENVQGDDVQSTKVLIDGNLYILRGEKLFDVTGRLVK